MIGKKLRDLRSKSGKDQRTVAKEIGINVSVLSLYENEKRAPDIENLKKLSDYYNVTSDYLIGRSDLPAFPSEGEASSQSAVSVKVLGSLPAGVPFDEVEDVIDIVTISPEQAAGGSRYIGVLVQDDSMYPKYIPGDILIVELTSNVRNNEDCLVYVGSHNAIVRTIHQAGTHIILVPVNQKYDPATYGPWDDPVKIVGIVRELRRRI